MTRGIQQERMRLSRRPCRAMSSSRTRRHHCSSSWRALDSAGAHGCPGPAPCDGARAGGPRGQPAPPIGRGPGRSARGPRVSAVQASGRRRRPRCGWALGVVRGTQRTFGTRATLRRCPASARKPRLRDRRTTYIATCSYLRPHSGLTVRAPGEPRAWQQARPQRPADGQPLSVFFGRRPTRQILAGRSCPRAFPVAVAW